MENLRWNPDEIKKYVKVMEDNNLLELDIEWEEGRRLRNAQDI